MKKIIILLFSSILFFSCKKEDAGFFNKNQNIDSLLLTVEKSKSVNYKLKTADKIVEYIDQNKLDSISRLQYMALARIYLSLNDLKYVKICELLISNPSVPINHQEISFSGYILGNYYYNIDNYEKSFLHLSKAEKSFTVLNKKHYLCYVINTKANILTFKKDFVGAEILSIKALRIAKQEQNNLLIYNCYLTLGNSLMGLNNLEKAIEYYNIAIETAEKLKSDPNYLSSKLQPLNYLSLVYQKQKQYYQAIKITKKGLAILENKNKEILIYSYLTNNLAYSKFKLGDKSSLKQFQETLQIGYSIKSIPIQITSKTHLGEYYLAEKDTVKANFYLKDAQLQAHKNNIFEDELKILQLLTKANPIEENFYSNRYIQLNDSLQNVERATRDKFARIAFETDEITTQKNSLTLEKEYLSFQRWMIGAISLFSLIIMVLWFKNKSQKAKTRELLLKEEQKKAEAEIFQLMIDQQNKIEEGKSAEKQRISLELHDNVMGNLSGIRVVLWGELFHQGLADKEPFVALLEGIQKIEKEVRNIAHNLNTNMFSGSSSFVEVVKELIINIENHSAVKFEIEASPTVNWDGINNTIKINLYRIIQEALHNIEKYANAKNVSIAIMQNENVLTIEITDDGKGFDTQNSNEGIGIKNMKTRMASLNGTITIESKIKNGTKINLTVSI